MAPEIDYDRDDANDPDLRYVSITPEQLSRALAEVAGCEACSPNGGEIPFDCLLVEVVEQETENVDFIMPEPARCPRCHAAIHEKTLVEPVGGVETESLQSTF